MEISYDINWLDTNNNGLFVSEVLLQDLERDLKLSWKQKEAEKILNLLKESNKDNDIGETIIQLLTYHTTIKEDTANRLFMGDFISLKDLISKDETTQILLDYLYEWDLFVEWRKIGNNKIYFSFILCHSDNTCSFHELFEDYKRNFGAKYKKSFIGTSCW